MLRVAVATALSLTLGFSMAFADEPKPDFAAGLPARVGQWNKPDKPDVYDRDTLYTYIDGGSELYLAFDFVRAITFEYAAGEDDTIKVDLFDMGSPRGAFGAFAHGRETLAEEVGQGSDYGGGLLTFWKHRWFVSILGYPETAAKRKAIYELGRSIAALIPETGPLPPILAALPKEGLLGASVRTFHHPLLQNDYVTVSLKNPLAIGKDTEAVLARYLRQGERHVLMLVDYPAEEAAGKAQRAFTETVLGGASPGRMGEHWAGIRKSGKRLVIVLAASSRQVVERALQEVP
jgi:hypothetical protein